MLDPSWGTVITRKSISFAPDDVRAKLPPDRYQAKDEILQSILEQEESAKNRHHKWKVRELNKADGKLAGLLDMNSGCVRESAMVNWSGSYSDYRHEVAIALGNFIFLIILVVIKTIFILFILYYIIFIVVSSVLHQKG